MKSNRLEELVNKKLDGQLSEQENFELEKLVLDSKEAKAHLEKMQLLHAALARAAGESKSADVSQEVMKRITNKAFPQNSAKVRSLFRMNITRYAAILVIGLLLGSMLTYLWLSDPARIDSIDARASIASQGSKSYFYSGAGWMISLNHYMVENEIVIYFVSRSENDMNVQMQFNPQVFRIENAVCVGCGFTPQIDAFRGMINFYVNGEVVYKAHLKNPGGIQMPVPFEIKRDDEILYNGEIFLR